MTVKGIMSIVSLSISRLRACSIANTYYNLEVQGPHYNNMHTCTPDGNIKCIKSYYHADYGSPNRSTVVLGVSCDTELSPPNMATSVIPGLRRKAAAM